MSTGGKQTSIHSFFATLKPGTSGDTSSTTTAESSVIEIRRFFYLKWTNRYSPVKEAVWLKDRPADVNYITEVNWGDVRKTHTFYLCGCFPDLNDGRFNIINETKYRNLANLKSHLQKNIRKGDEQLALSTAIHMLRLDQNELLRRLPIIMIEDVMLHKSFSTLIWLMVSQSLKQNKFPMKQYMYEWLLGVIYVLCKIEKKDVIEYEDLTQQPKLLYILDSYDGYGEMECSLLYSMYLRISYGGMKCDIEMFKQYINRWKKRFTREIEGEEEISMMRVRNISFFSVKTLELEEWDLSAIDFHCNDRFIEYIKKRYPDVEEDEIRKMVWLNSSSINYRKSTEIYERELWTNMKTYILKTQKYILDSSF